MHSRPGDQPDPRGAPVSGPGPTTAATDLVQARNQMLDTAHRLDAPALRNVLVDLHDFWLTSKGAEIGIRENSGFALVAVGGLGRKELLPYSDLDLILLHDDVDPAVVAEIADQLWYPLWDANVKLDHSVRTVPQALQVSRADMSAALGLLEARHICGDESLTDLLIAGVRSRWRTDIRSRLPEFTQSARDRWRFAGDIAHRAEPDLKHGRGGLRDVHMLQALAFAQLTDGAVVRTDDAIGGLNHAYHRLLDIRTELHRVAGRPRETLRAQDADEIGSALRLGDRFDLARTVSDCARTVSFSVSVGFRTAENQLPRRGLSKFRRSPIRRPLDEGVVEHSGEVVLARNAIPSKDPGLILRVAAASARTGMPMASSTLTRLADYAPELREPWPAEALSDLLVLLSTGEHMISPVEALDRTGLWGRLLPEWGAVRDLPPRDQIHTWTVDRHLVETAAYASQLTTTVSRPDLLLLGALIHDIGKGRDGDHSVVGAELATQIGRRLGLWPEDVDILTRMVRHHLLLPITATRRDLSDPETIDGVVDALGGSLILVQLLGALAEADSRATGPGVWGDWKARLVRELVQRCEERIGGAEPYEPQPLSADLLARAEDGGVHVEMASTDNPHTYRLTMIAPDQPGTLSKMAGVIALASMSCHSATVQSHADSAINTFMVVPAFGDPPPSGLLRQQLSQALAGTLNVTERLDAKEQQGQPSTGSVAAPALPALFSQAPPRVIWVDDYAKDPGTVIMELRAGDRVGLLCRACAVIEANGADILWAKVATLGSTVVDSFCVRLPVNDRTLRDRIEKAIVEIVPPTAPPRSPDEGGTGSSKIGVPIS